MADFAGGPVGETFRCTLSHIEREIGYLFRFRTNIRTLEGDVEMLTARKNDVKRLVDAANMNNEVIREGVKTWLRRVEIVLDEARSLNGKAALINRWFKGWILCSRFTTGRSGQKTIDVVKWLLEDPNSFGDRVSDQIPVQHLMSVSSHETTGCRVSDQIPIQHLMSVSSEETTGGRVSDQRPVQHLMSVSSEDTTEGRVSGGLECNAGFKAFGSRVATANQLLQKLKDGGTSLLGVYGMSGVGKTMLISALAIHVKEQKIFDEVVVVTLTHTPEIKLIQGDIANGLDLKFQEDDTLATRAKRLFQRLSQDRNTLIVLDNLWQRVELSQVGIPQGLKNCKVVFTTRNQDVCNSMDAGPSRIKVDILSPEDSWDLFREKAGAAVDYPSFNSVARDVLNKCQGLPLLIVTLGRALYGKSEASWGAALQSLRNSTILVDPVSDDMPHVFSVMKLSYDYLHSDEQRLCFLFCCLFPDGYPISMDQLLFYTVGEKVLQSSPKLQDARHRLHTIVDKLISLGLLNSKSGCFMMHDVVRDVAIAIASDSKEGKGFVVKAGMVLTDWPDMELDQCRRLSFITTTGSHMNWRLPNQIQASHLLTLSFNGNEKLVEIPADFFREATSLVTLDLSYTGIQALPQALECLEKLRTLLLEGCRLKDVCLSNKLEKLEMFSLRYSTTERFSVSGEITTLKLLDLSYCSGLQQIDSNSISSFRKVEELYLFDSFRAWESEVRENDDHSFRELCSSFEQVEDAFFKGKELAKEYASSSDEEKGADYAKLSEVTSLTRLTSLELHVGNSECLSQSIPNWENLTRFRIAVGVIHNFSPFGIGDGLQLEKSMYIAPTQEKVADWVIALLKRANFLHLEMGSPKLNDLVKLDLSSQLIFRELKVLILEGFRGATTLISCNLLVRFKNLNKLVIDGCYYVDKLVEFEQEDQAVSIDSSSLPRINTSKFSKIPRSSIFPNLTYLRVCDCFNLKYMFPLRVLRLLSQLEMLYVSNCNGMKMVIIYENSADAGDADSDKLVLPKLKVFSLENLKYLLHVFEQDIHVEWPALEELTVKKCPKLKKLPLGSQSVPKLTKLTVDGESWFHGMEWDDQNIKLRLQFLLDRVHLKGMCLTDVQVLGAWPLTLRVLELSDYEGVSLIPSDLLVKFLNLDKLVIKNCMELEKIIELEGDDKAGGKQGHAVVDTSVGLIASSSVSERTFSKLPKSLPFSNLTYLRVSGCNKLNYLFPMRIIRNLRQLEWLDIRFCNAMKMIILRETAEDDEGEYLQNLRKLDVSGCNKLMYLFPMSVSQNLVKLESIEVLDCNAMELVIVHETVKDGGAIAGKGKKVLPNLLHIRVSDCENLKYLFPMRVIRDMQQLQHICIVKCHAMEMIIVRDISDTDEDTGKYCVVLPNLAHLTVRHCNKLKFLLLMRIIRVMLELQTLHISDCDSMETIIVHETSEDDGEAHQDKAILPKLEDLELENLPQLLSFIRQDILLAWPSLQKLTVHECISMKKLHLGPGSMPRLKTLSVSPKEGWFERLEWEDEEVKSRLEQLAHEQTDTKWKRYVR